MANTETDSSVLFFLKNLLQMTGTGANQVITTYDPRLTSLGLPQYPPLSMTTDASKIEEIRRTVYVSDLDPKVRS